MVHSKPALPAGHGELLTRPAFEEWAQLAQDNHIAAAQWSFSVAGHSADEVRSLARREALSAAAEFSGRLGVEVKPPGEPGELIVMTGHQPELYHPGVWIKDFLLQRLSREIGASAIDLVVDSDGFDSVAVSSPCMTPGVERCHQYLAVGSEGAYFAGQPVPSTRDIDDFCSATDEMLGSLPSPAIGRHFSAFCECLRSAARDASNLAELVTIARRRYEARVGSDYLELPMTSLARTVAWRTFVVDIALAARRFAEIYNAELAEYRLVNKVRSPAQPFPDLAIDAEGIELPLWFVKEGRRHAVVARVQPTGEVQLTTSEGESIVVLPTDVPAALDILDTPGVLLAPKALALTLFTRVFVADLMIHGVGGARYDRVTDGVCRLFYGVEPPRFVVASMTMYLPLGAHVVTADEVAMAKERLNRLEHNPDALLSEVEFDSADERNRARSLSAEKTDLVSAIAAPDADKKLLGKRIREVNEELSGLLAPLRAGLAEELARLEAQQVASEILTDRTYPFCFWSPSEVADKAG